MVVRLVVVGLLLLVAVIDVVAISICCMADDMDDDEDQEQWCQEWEKENAGIRKLGVRKANGGSDDCNGSGDTGRIV